MGVGYLLCLWLRLFLVVLVRSVVVGLRLVAFGVCYFWLRVPVWVVWLLCCLFGFVWSLLTLWLFAAVVIWLWCFSWVLGWVLV